MSKEKGGVPMNDLYEVVGRVVIGMQHKGMPASEIVEYVKEMHDKMKQARDRLFNQAEDHRINLVIKEWTEIDTTPDDDRPKNWGLRWYDVK